MIKTLWFFIKAALFVGGAIWLTSQPGEMNLHFLGYDVRVQTGVFLISLLVFVLIVFQILRFVRAIFMTPKTIAKYRQDYYYKLGYYSLTRGLVAVAAGDSENATKYAKDAQKFLKNETGLPLFLQAQAAQLRGEENVSQRCFEALIDNKDTAFLGLQGVMKSALHKGDYARALIYARKMLKNYPKQDGVFKMVYQLEIKNNHWDNVIALGKKAQKLNIFPSEKIISDRVAIYLMRYDYDVEKGDIKSAYRQVTQAYKLNAFFVPTVQRLVSYYLHHNKKKKAVPIIEAIWKENPHPKLASMWGELYSASKKEDNTKRLAWFEKLSALNPNAVEGHVATAKAAIDMQYWGEAKAHLMAAEKIYPTAEIFHLRAIVEKNITHNEDQVEDVLGKIPTALPSKTWICRETGMTYDEWSAISMPHENFNTMVWDVARSWAVNDDHPCIFEAGQSPLLSVPVTQ